MEVHSDAVTVLLFSFGILFSVIGFLCVFILKSIKKDLENLMYKVEDQGIRLVKLEAEHAVCFNNGE